MRRFRIPPDNLPIFHKIAGATGPTHPIASHLTPWPGHEGFLATYNERLVNVRLTNDTALFELTDLGLGDFSVDSFGTDETGTFIYYPVNRQGVGAYEVNEEGSPTDVPVEDNRIMTCKLHNGSFGEPYVFSHVKHSLENLVNIGHSGAAMAFLAGAITDFGVSKADLRYIAIPSVVAPTLLGVALPVPVVEAGTDAVFLLTIRNDGNSAESRRPVLSLDCWCSDWRRRRGTCSLFRPSQEAGRLSRKRVSPHSGEPRVPCVAHRSGLGVPRAS